MKFIFDPVYIKDNSILFYTFLIVIVLIIILTIIFVFKELGKKK